MAEPDLPESPLKYSGGRNLLLSSIKQNKLSQSHQYIASSPREDGLAPTEVYRPDVSFVTATHGSPESLCVLLEMDTAAPEVVERIRQHRLYLLHDACGAANLDIVRFILDIHNSSASQILLGTVDLHGGSDVGETAILAAATSPAWEKDEGEGGHSEDGHGLMKRAVV